LRGSRSTLNAELVSTLAPDTALTWIARDRPAGLLTQPEPPLTLNARVGPNVTRYFAPESARPKPRVTLRSIVSWKVTADD
jgi:hypothetical protein